MEGATCSPDTSRLLEKVGAMKQAGRDPPEVRLHPPWGLKMGLGLPASDGGSEEGRWLARLQGVSAGCLSHLGPHGWLPPRSTCTGEQGCSCGHRGAWLVLDQPSLLLGLVEVWLHQWLASSAFSREALIEG